MAFPKSKRVPLIVDELPYIACVSRDGRTADGGVRIRVIIQAEYGLRPRCVVGGMVNREYWLDFPNNDMERTFTITPRVICEIIRYSLSNGWDPNTMKTQAAIELDNDGLFAILARIKAEG
jgi:hypothetical protein